MDSWPLSPTAPRNHTSLEERDAAARDFLEKWPSFRSLLDSVCVDTMDDSTTKSLGLWPERFVLTRGGVVAWASTFADEAPTNLTDKLRHAAHEVFGSTK